MPHLNTRTPSSEDVTQRSEKKPALSDDLFEQVGRDQRSDLASALSELLDGEVLAEMNDFVSKPFVPAELQKKLIKNMSA